MPFLKSHPDNAGPANVFTAYPDIFGHWTKMGQALMNAPSPFTTGEREMIAAYTVGVAQCQYAYVAHSAAAYAWEIEDGLVDKLLADLDSAPVEDRFKPLLAFVRKLTATPNDVAQADVDAVLDAGWDETALQYAAFVCARMCFMHRLIQAHGFTPMSPELAKRRAEERRERGYGNLYPELAAKE